MTRKRIYFLLIWLGATFGGGSLINTSLSLAIAVITVVAYTALLLGLIAVFGKPWSK